MMNVLASFRKASLFLACCAIAVMMLQISADVAAKYLFNAPIIGTLETSSYYYMVAIVFLPLAAVEARHEHVSVNLFVSRMPRQLQRWIYVFSCALAIAYFGALTWRTGLDAISATQNGETVMANFKFYVWPSRWVLPVSFLAMVLTLMGHMINAIRDETFIDELDVEPDQIETINE